MKPLVLLQMHVKPPPHWIQDVVKVSKDGVFCTYSELFVAAGATTGAVMIDIDYLQAYRKDLYAKIVKNEKKKRRGGISKIYFDGELETTEIDKMLRVYQLLQSLPSTYKENDALGMSLSILAEHLGTVNTNHAVALQKKRHLSELGGNTNYVMPLQKKICPEQGANFHIQRSGKFTINTGQEFYNGFGHQIADDEDLESMVLPCLHQSTLIQGGDEFQSNYENPQISQVVQASSHGLPIEELEKYKEGNLGHEVLNGLGIQCMEDVNQGSIMIPCLNRQSTENQTQNSRIQPNYENTQNSQAAQGDCHEYTLEDIHAILFDQPDTQFENFANEAFN